MSPRYSATALAKGLACTFLLTGCLSAVMGQPVSMLFPNPMLMQIEGDSLVLGGWLDPARLKEFDALVEASHPKRIVFRDMIGGPIDSVQAYGRRLLVLKIETQVDGQCFSACALVMLCGESRSANLSRPAVIGFHGPRGASGEPIPDLVERYRRLIRWRTSGKFPPDLVELALSNNRPDGALYVYVQKTLGFRVTWAEYCETGRSCRTIRGADAFDFGVLTQ